MASDWRGRRRSALAAFLCAAVVSLSSWKTVPAIQRIDLAVFDSYQRASPRPYDPELPVRIIAIDREALAKFGQWPWPRPVIGELVTRLSDLGAAVIGFDMVFAEPDRTSPEEIARSLAAVGQDRIVVPNNNPSHDAIFAEAIGNAHVVLGTILTFSDSADIPVIKAQPSFLGANAKEALFAFPGADINRPQLSEAASGVGSIALTPEDRQDGVIRRTPMAVRRGDTVIPAITLEMLRVAQGARGYLIRGLDAGEQDNRPRITGMKVGAIPIETSADGGVWVRYAGTQPERTISAARIFTHKETEMRPQIDGRLVILAATAPGLGDIVATPMSSTAPGAEVHAEILEQILSGTSLTRPDWIAGAERLAVLGIGLMVALTILMFGGFAGSAFAAALIVVTPVISFFAFRDYGVLAGPTAPVIGGLSAWGGAALVDFFGAQRARREIQRQFEHFVAPDVIAEIAQDPAKHMTPGGEERELTILFSDVRSFSTISAQLNPQDLIDWLNSYLTPMAEAVIEEKGTIDKFIGDAIMAFWNAPRRDEHHARHAMRGALSMARAMDGLNERFRLEGRPLAKFGIGLNTGPCSVGRIGARKRLDYTCIGDAVNVASRIEGLTKMYATTILVGEDSARQASDFALIALDRVEVKGREGVPLDIFGLYGDQAVAADAVFLQARAAWDEALGCYRNRDFDAAQRHFRRIASRIDIDLAGPAQTFLTRIEGFDTSPPEADWDAVFHAESK